jgi:hypothetical protein
MDEIIQSSPAFFYTAAISTALFVIMIILSLCGMDVDEIDTDSSMDIDDSDGAFLIFSFKAILAGIMGFGWCGLIYVYEHGWSPLMACIPATICAVLLMKVVIELFRQIKKLEKVHDFQITHAIGKEGKSLIPIKKRQSGRISITIDERSYEFNAITTDSEGIRSGEIVMVRAVKNDKTLVVTTKNNPNTRR